MCYKNSMKFQGCHIYKMCRNPIVWSMKFNVKKMNQSLYLNFHRLKESQCPVRHIELLRQYILHGNIVSTHIKM